jgi:hypothetical protein
MMVPPTALPKVTDAEAAAAAPPAPGVPPSGPAARALKRLWLHEALRVFYDRLVDAADREWLIEKLRGSCRDRLGEEIDSLLAHLLPAGQEGGRVGQEELRKWVCSLGIALRHLVLPSKRGVQVSFRTLPCAPPVPPTGCSLSRNCRGLTPPSSRSTPPPPFIDPNPAPRRPRRQALLRRLLGPLGRPRRPPLRGASGRGEGGRGR